MTDNESFEPTLGPIKRKRSSILKPPEKRASRDMTRTVSFNDRCLYKELHKDGTCDITNFFLGEDMDLTMMDIVEPDSHEPHNQTICSSVDMSMDQTTYGVHDIDVTLVPEQTIEQSLNESAMIDEQARMVQVELNTHGGRNEVVVDVDSDDDLHNTTLKPPSSPPYLLNKTQAPISEEEQHVSTTAATTTAALLSTTVGTTTATTIIEKTNTTLAALQTTTASTLKEATSESMRQPKSNQQQQHHLQQSPPSEPLSPTATMTINETTTKFEDTMNTHNHTMMNTMMTTMMTQISDISSLNASNITNQTVNETLYGAFHDSNNFSMQSSRTSGVDTLLHNIEALNECILKVDQETEEYRQKLDQEIEELLTFYRHIVNKNDKYEFAIAIFGLRHSLWLIIKVNPETYPNEKLRLRFAINKKDRHMYPFAEYAESVRRSTKEGSFGFLTRFVINAQRFRRFLRKVGYKKVGK